MKKRIAIWASGNGTNAEAIMAHFKRHPSIEVVLLQTNRVDAGALQRAKLFQVPAQVFDRDQLASGEVLATLLANRIDYLILAGFLWLVPSSILSVWEGRILNIHPALLPKYGGKGMYGNFVHEAVLNNEESFSGITIHQVNAAYDKGQIVFQAPCPVLADDTPEQLAHRIHELEHQYYPGVIEAFILDRENIV